MSKTKDKEKVPCQFCGKEYSAKGVANHEKACDKNPANMDDVVEESTVDEEAVKPKKTPEELKAEAEEAVRLGYGNVQDMPVKKQMYIAQSQQRKLATHYKKQEKAIVRISDMYQPYFGKQMCVRLNGISIYVPCDDKKYEIPKSYAMEVEARLRRVGDMRKRGKRMSDVKKNFDGRELGSLNLIKQV